MHEINLRIIELTKKYNIDWEWQNNENLAKNLFDEIWNKYIYRHKFVVFNSDIKRVFYKVNKKEKEFEDQDYNIINLKTVVDQIKYFDFYSNEIEELINEYETKNYKVDEKQFVNVMTNFLDEFENVIKLTRLSGDDVQKIIDVWSEDKFTQWVPYEYLNLTKKLNNIVKNLKIYFEFRNLKIELIKMFFYENHVTISNLEYENLDKIFTNSFNIKNQDFNELTFENKNYINTYEIIKKFKESNQFEQYQELNKIYLEYQNRVELFKTLLKNSLINKLDKELILSYEKSCEKTVQTRLFENNMKVFINKFDERFKYIENLKLSLVKKYSDLNLQDLEQFIFYNLKMQLDRIQNKGGIIQEIQKPLLQELIKKLPFELTLDQNKCIELIVEKMSNESRMNLLIQGDVGSGKTLMAQISTIISLINNKQVLLVVPIIQLRNQHYKEYKKLINNFLPNKKIGLMNELSDDDYQNYDLIVGGKSLYKKKFNDVGLVIFDEPHLLGSTEKRNFNLINNYFDTLWTTATPQPQTQVLSLIGGLDRFVIKTMPNGRKQVRSSKFNISEDSFKKVLLNVENEMKKGHFVFIVVNRKSGSSFNVNKAYEFYSHRFPNKRIAVATSDNKNNELFEDIKNKKYDMLISTNIIKVGINIPHATVIVIHYTNFMGAFDLWQLKGRVGRNSLQSYAYFETPSNKILDSNSAIESVINSRNNLELTKSDLIYRGIETILGTQQSGNKYGNKEYNKKIVEAYMEIATKNREIINDKW